MGFRLLAICPRICKENGRLCAATAWRVRLLTLGMFYRSVIVDPEREVVIVRRRYGWFFARGWRIPFRSIRAIGYGYRDENTLGSLMWAHDSIDLFSVRLKLHSERERHLFHFCGDGTFTNNSPLPNWFYWEDYLFDVTGSQERESRLFVDLLSRMIGVPVEP